MFDYIAGVISCVNYADYLNCTLPTTVAELDQVVVVTSPSDIETQHICSQFANVTCIQTDVWYAQLKGKRSLFNKGRGLNVGLDHLWSKWHQVPGWICVIDADIMLPRNFRTTINPVNDCLYSCRRRLCTDIATFGKEWSHHQLETLPRHTQETGMWGNRKIRTDNAAGLYGYLQMWSAAINARFPTNFGTANGYDVRFGMGWPEDRRRWLPCEVLHLGGTRQNWNGRVTEKWNQPERQDKTEAAPAGKVGKRTSPE